MAESAGSRSQVTGLVGALVIALMLVALPGLFADLPQPTLAAVVIAASVTLADIPGSVRLYQQRRTDFAVALTAFLGVTLFGVLPGILLAVGLSVANVFRRAWRPYRAQLGRVEGLPGMHDLTVQPTAEVLPGCPVYRFDAPLIFANAGTFRQEVTDLAATATRPAWIVVAAEPMTDVDTTACDMLQDLVPALDAQGVKLVFAEMKTHVREEIDRFDLSSVLTSDRFFPTIRSAVQAYEGAHPSQWEEPEAIEEAPSMT